MITQALSIIPFINLLRNYGLDISTAEVILAQKIFDSSFATSRNKLHNALKSILIRNYSDVEKFNKSFDIFFNTNFLGNEEDLDNISKNSSENLSKYSTDTILTDAGEGLDSDFFSEANENKSRTEENSKGINISANMHLGYDRNFRSLLESKFGNELVRWTPKEIKFVSYSISFDNNIKRREVNQRFSRFLEREALEKWEEVINIYFRYAQSLNVALEQAKSHFIEKRDVKRKEISDISKNYQKKISEFLLGTKKFLIRSKIISDEDFSQFILLKQSQDGNFDLLKTDFSKINKNIEEIKNELIKLGKKLAVRERRRQRSFSKGKIDFRRTFRSNLTHGGAFLDIKLTSKKPETPEIFLILDVSMSMSWIAEFFFLISYAGELIWKLNLFEFNNTTVEITQILRSKTLNEVYRQRKRAWENAIRPRIGHSNYETSLEDFYELASQRLTKKSRIIILGDCRDWLGYWRSSGWENSRFGEPESKYWIKKLVTKSKEVIILNPEPKSLWNTGDSVCDYYKKAGAKIHYVYNLESLIKFIFKY